MREPRDDWSLDGEGSAWSAEDTYAARRKRERLDEAAREAKKGARGLLNRVRARDARDEQGRR